MNISTKRTMSPTEIETFKSENKEILNQLSGFNKKGFLKEINIEVPSYQLIDGTDCATVKLSAKRRKTIVE